MDPADPATWWSCMPALGETVTVETIEQAYRTLPLAEFRRAFLNQLTLADDRVIPRTAWDLVCGDYECAAAVFGVDVNPERSAAAVVAAGGGTVEVVKYLAGVGWLIPELERLTREYGCRVVLDAAGPAGSFVADLERSQIPFEVLAPKDATRATGCFYDAVVNDKIRVRRDRDLDDAVAAAARRPVGDAWTWGRKTSRADISPLVAATLAFWSTAQAEEVPVDAFAAWS